MRLKPAVVALVVLSALSLPARAEPGALCSWYLKTDADTLNVAFPDESATYWSTEFYSVPGSRLVIHGTYPFARYLSFHAYDLATRTVGSLADYEIDPDLGSGNPFRDIGASADPAHRRYTVFVEFAARPASPAPNTLYAGATADGAPNVTGALIMRVYVPDDPATADGGVGLPDVTIEGPAGSLALPQCDPLPPSLTGGALNEFERTSSFPDEVPRVVPLGNAYTDPPRTTRFYGLDRLAWDRVPPNAVTDGIPRFKGTFFSNDQNAYLITRTTRTFGDLIAYRFKAPTFPDTRAGTPAAAPREVRYWSLCEYELATERFIACSADYQSDVGTDGYVRFVISDASDRPADEAMDGINWLPWGGPYYDGFIGYRQMIPDASFAPAVANIAEGQDGATVMGDYWPEIAYCSHDVIESGGGYDSCFG